MGRTDCQQRNSKKYKRIMGRRRIRFCSCFFALSMGVLPFPLRSFSAVLTAAAPYSAPPPEGGSPAYAGNAIEAADPGKTLLSASGNKGKTGKKEVIDRDLGEFTITAYDYTESLDADGNLQDTFSGVKPRAGHTIAVDPAVIPPGSRVMIDGVVYTAEDTGGKIKGKRIDIYFDTHEETDAFGLRKKQVFLLK